MRCEQAPGCVEYFLLLFGLLGEQFRILFDLGKRVVDVFEDFVLGQQATDALVRASVKKLTLDGDLVESAGKDVGSVQRGGHPICQEFAGSRKAGRKQTVGSVVEVHEPEKRVHIIQLSGGGS